MSMNHSEEAASHVSPAGAGPAGGHRRLGRTDSDQQHRFVWAAPDAFPEAELMSAMSRLAAATAGEFEPQNVANLM